MVNGELAVRELLGVGDTILAINPSCGLAWNEEAFELTCPYQLRVRQFTIHNSPFTTSCLLRTKTDNQIPSVFDVIGASAEKILAHVRVGIDNCVLIDRDRVLD